MGAVRLLLENRYVFNPFWQHHNGIDGFADWEDRFKASARSFAQAFQAGAARHLDRAEALSPGWDAQAMVDSWAELEHDADRSYLQREVALALELRRGLRSETAHP